MFFLDCEKVDDSMTLSQVHEAVTTILNLKNIYFGNQLKCFDFRFERSDQQVKTQWSISGPNPIQLTALVMIRQ